MNLLHVLQTAYERGLRRHFGSGRSVGDMRSGGQTAGEMNDFPLPFASPLILDSFVNSQEWTLSRSVPELKVVSKFYYF